MEPGERIGLQLRFVSAIYRAELERGDAEVLEGFLERALALLDRLEPEVKADLELRALLDEVRRELDGQPA